MISQEELEKLSQLSKIKISKTESSKFAKQLQSIFDYVAKVQDYNFLKKTFTKNKKIKLRKDNVSNDNFDNLVQQFGDRENNLLKVKKVL